MTDWLQTMLGKKYKADQPRVPAGDPAGGQWTSGGTRPVAIMTGSARDLNGRNVGLYRVPKNTILPSRLLNRSSTLVADKNNTLYVADSSNIDHATIIDTIGDTKHYDEYTRVIVTPRVVKFFSSTSGVANDPSLERFEWGVERYREVDKLASRRIQRVARAMISSGFSGDLDVQWKLEADPSTVVKSTLERMAEKGFKQGRGIGNLGNSGRPGEVGGKWKVPKE